MTNTMYANFQAKQTTLTFLAQIRPKIDLGLEIRFWGRNFKNLSADSRSAPPRDHACQFSVKINNFEFFDINLGKLPNYVQYFGSNNIEGVAESWVEAEISWMEVGAWFSNTYFFNLKKK